VFVCCFAIAALGFGIVGFGIVGFGIDGCAAADGDVVFAATFFGAGLFAFAVVLLSLGFAAGFFAAAFGSSFLSVNSNAGLGSALSCGIVLVALLLGRFALATCAPAEFMRVEFMRVIKAAGFTPAAAAALAADAASAGCLARPSMSGFTIT
jgi:hypothetical protein